MRAIETFRFVTGRAPTMIPRSELFPQKRGYYMADNAPVQMKSTLGLTGLTMNAMALIAPGAFLWLTFQIQATTGVTAPSMWIGIVVALLLCLATAVCRSEEHTSELQSL